MGGAAGGAVAWYTGGDVTAGIVGGAIGGALTGSGVGLMAGAVSLGAVGAGTALTATVTIGAAGNVVGNTTSQIMTNMNSGESVHDSIADINTSQQIVSGAAGAAGGLVAGAGVLAGAVVTNAERQAANMISQHMNDVSRPIIQSNLPTALSEAQRIQNAILSATSARAPGQLAEDAIDNAAAAIGEGISKTAEAFLEDLLSQLAHELSCKAE